MVARLISPNRPRLLAAVMAAREHEIERLKFEREERGGTCNHRLDLLEFATFALLVELTGGRLAHEPCRRPFLVMLTAMTMKYRNPVLCRALIALARESVPL